MRNIKKTLGVVALLAVATGMTVVGVSELRTSRKLAAEGKAATAEVVNKGFTYRAKRRKSFYLEVKYQTEAGQTLTQRTSVGADTFETVPRGATLPLHYLPTQPDVFALGAKVPPNYFHIIMGAVFFGIGGFYFLFGKERESSPATP
jgi:hypothetical protein